MTPEQRHTLERFGGVMGNLRVASRPETRVAEHFLLCDLNETYMFAIGHLDALAAVEAVDGGLRRHDEVAA